MTKPNSVLPGVQVVERSNKTKYRGRAYIYGKYKSGPYRDTPEEAHEDYLTMRKAFPFRNRGPNKHPANLPKLSQKESDKIREEVLDVPLFKPKSNHQPNQELKGTPFYGL